MHVYAIHVHDDDMQQMGIGSRGSFICGTFSEINPHFTVMCDNDDVIPTFFT